MPSDRQPYLDEAALADRQGHGPGQMAWINRIPAIQADGDRIDGLCWEHGEFERGAHCPGFGDPGGRLIIKGWMTLDQPGHASEQV